MSRVRQWLKWIIDYRYVSIVLFIVVQNFLYVGYISLGLYGRDFFGSGMFILMLIFCILAVSKDKRSLKRGLVWGAFALFSIWLSIFFQSGILSLGYLLFILYTSVVIIYNVTISKEININIIFGSIAGFLLIGIIGSVICTLLEANFPGSFNLGENQGNDPIITFFYFSFVTMTSLGYGDILPTTDMARTISVFLVIFGQFYLAIQVAILVGKYIMRSNHKHKKDRV